MITIIQLQNCNGRFCCFDFVIKDNSSLDYVLFVYLIFSLPLLFYHKHTMHKLTTLNNKKTCTILTQTTDNTIHTLTTFAFTDNTSNNHYVLPFIYTKANTFSAKINVTQQKLLLLISPLNVVEKHIIK